MPETANIWFLIYFIGIAIILDLLIRWISFGRVESVGIDIATFSMAYSLLKLLSEIFSKGDNALEWGVKLLIGFVIALGLAGLHRYLLGEIRERISSELRKLQHTLQNGNKKDQILDLVPVIEYATDLALAAWKPGKKARREKVIEAIKSLGLDPDNVINKETLLLGKNLRIFMVIFFTVVGFISIVIPILELNFLR